MSKLLPCPFCGDTELDGGAPFPLNHTPTPWIIRCGNPLCGAEIERGDYLGVIEAWNRRAPAAEQQSKIIIRNDIEILARSPANGGGILVKAKSGKELFIPGEFIE